MLNIESVRNGRMFTAPCRWGIVENPFSGETAIELARAFPRGGFQYRTHKLGRFCRRPLFKLPDNQLQNTDDLSPGYGKLAGTLNSLEYRRALSDLISIDVTTAPIEASFWRYDHAITFVPHLDLPGKIVTQVFYLNEEWPHRWGGCLRFLNSNDIEDSAFQISPLPNVSTILVRSEASWHAITPISPEATDSRNTLTVHFYHSDPQLIAAGIALAEV